MKAKIKDAIESIIKEKAYNNEAFPSAHSVEVASRLKMNARDIEVIAKDIQGIRVHETINGTFYET